MDVRIILSLTLYIYIYTLKNTIKLKGFHWFNLSVQSMWLWNHEKSSQQTPRMCFSFLRSFTDRLFSYIWFVVPLCSSSHTPATKSKKENHNIYIYICIYIYIYIYIYWIVWGIAICLLPHIHQSTTQSLFYYGKQALDHSQHRPGIPKIFWGWVF